MLLKFKEAFINTDFIEAITLNQDETWTVRMHKSDDFNLDCSEIELLNIINRIGVSNGNGTRKLSI